jgi:hypothetical protein
MNDRYNPDNYRYHVGVNVSGDDWVKLDLQLTSNLLVIKWYAINPNKLLSPLEGLTRQFISTPLGDEIPKDRILSTVDDKRTIQLLSMGRVDFPYRLAFKNPIGIKLSHVVIGEYTKSSSYTENPTNGIPTQNIYLDESGIPLASNTPLITLMPLYRSNFSDPSLANAIADLADAIEDQTDTQSASIASAINTAPVTTTSLDINVGNTPVLISAKGNGVAAVSVKNASNHKVRLWFTDTVLPLTTVYSSSGSAIELSGSTANSDGDLYEVPNPSQKTNIYAIASNPNGKVTVTRSVYV